MTIAAFAVSPSDLRASSENLLNSPRGRLSTQKKPRSSRARRKVPFPEPLSPVMMMKEDGCTSSFRLDPTDIPVLPFIDDVQPFGLRVSKNQEFGLRTADLNGGVIHAHWLCSHFIIADDAGQPLAQRFLDFDNRGRRDDFTALVVIVVALSRDVAFLVLEDLFFDLVNHGS